MITKPLYEQLIDRRTGFITRLTPAPIHPNLPVKSFHGVHKWQTALYWQASLPTESPGDGF